jgi:hypothetical protein
VLLNQFYALLSQQEIHLTAIHGVGLGALELVQLKKKKFGQVQQKSGVS